jgi:hypothetical protein
MRPNWQLGQLFKYLHQKLHLHSMECFYIPWN